jgi:hypothetical protein
MPCRWLIVLCCVVGLTGSPLVSFAQKAEDHLRPMKGYFTSSSPAYYAKVQQTLYAGFSSQPLLGVVILPSFSPEYLLCIEHKGDQYFLTYRVCQTNIWYANHFAYAKPPKSKPVAVTTKSVEVNRPLVEALRQVFGQAIAQTKYPEPAYGYGSDGTTYTFVAFIEGVGFAGGETWSPRAGTNMSALVDLVANLNKLVDMPAEQHQTALIQQAHQLVEQFASKE